MKALVTGGAGFIGHHLVRALLDRGDDVAVIDDYSTGLRWRLDDVRDDIAIVEGDIRDAADLDRAIAGCEVVYHEAALPSVARSNEDPRASNDVNTTGTIEVMLAAARAGVRRVVLAASSSVYGDSEALPRRESQPTNPLSPYAVSKAAAEQYLHILGRLHGVETVALRYFNIFGPGQDPASQYAAVVPRFVLAGLHEERPVIFGTGRQSRDFTYVANAVHANLLAADAAVPPDATMNIGCGTRYSLLDLVETIGSCLGVPIEPTFEPARTGDVPHSQADISLAREHLRYDVVVPFEEGIRRTIDWYRTRPEA